MLAPALRWQNRFLDAIGAPRDAEEWQAAVASIVPEPPDVVRFVRMSGDRWLVVEASRAFGVSQPSVGAVDLREPVRAALRAAHKPVD